MQVYYAIGGVGMFLVGMEILTNALRDAAGSNLRRMLGRFTTTPLRGVLTGALGTAVIQSSSATTVLTVGFVGAGLLTMVQALGIIYGANIGTTATGWLVSLVGFKLDLDIAAMALLLPASLLDLLGKGMWKRIGRGLAGLCLLIIGLEMMQTGLGGFKDSVTPDILPGSGIGGLLFLVGVGLVMTIVMQSSSAAMALALVLLQGGAIELVQAAALVIGMNIGTTFTAILASVGGSLPMRQTAIANLIFNCVTAGFAFPLLLLILPMLNSLAQSFDNLTALLVFHTGFNLIGAAAFLPVTPKFAAMVARRVPEKAEDKLISLDRSLLKDTDAALVAAQGASEKISKRLFGALGQAMDAPPDYRGISALGPFQGALDELSEFLSHIHPERDNQVEEDTYSALLHQTDHMTRLINRASKTTHVNELLEDHVLRRPTLALGATLRRFTETDFDPREAARLTRLHDIVKHRKDKHRRGLLLGEHAGLYDLQEVFAHTDAMRWLDRSLHHAERVAHYQAIARRGFPSAPVEAEGKDT